MVLHTLFKNLFLAIIVFGLFAGHPANADEPKRLMIEGAGNLGIFDPSISKDPTTDRLWMSYSSVNESKFYKKSKFWAVSLRLAYSDDNGASWFDAGETAGHVEKVLGPMTETHRKGDIPAGSKGLWQSETSSLIYDPAAPDEEKWKLVWFQYLHANSVPFYLDHSWIALKMASTPEGLIDAEPIKLFSGLGVKNDGENTKAPAYSPTGGKARIRLNLDLTRAIKGANLKELTMCIFVEPGMYANQDAIYLAMYCADAVTDPITEEMVYFRCQSPCNMTDADSWEYLGRLFKRKDARRSARHHHFQAPSIVESNGKMFVVVTPVRKFIGQRYNGCRIYEFNDDRTRVKRKMNGKLRELARIDGIRGTHHGACAIFPDLVGGTLLSQYEHKADGETFRIYKSGVDLPD